jgi:hypothetical protein
VEEETKQTILDSALHLLNLPVLGPRPNTEKVVSTYLAPVEPPEELRANIGRVLAFRAREKMPGAAVGIAEMYVDSSDEAICLDANEAERQHIRAPRSRLLPARAGARHPKGLAQRPPAAQMLAALESARAVTRRDRQ